MAGDSTPVLPPASGPRN